MKKIIIWGHPLHSHTTSYIHYGFFKALKYMGYDVYWIENNEQNSNFDFNNSIVFAERMDMSFLPIVDNATYFIHNLYLDFEDKYKVDYKNVWNYLVYHESYNLPDDLKKIDNHSWISEKTKTIMIRWGTDLLPFEIDDISPVLYDKDKPYNYFVGSMQGPYIQNFAQISNLHGKEFINLGGYSGIESKNNNNSRFYTIEDNIKFVQDSYLSFDIRESMTVDDNPGYIACRIFKNISYGKWTGSNLPGISEFLDGNITENKNLEKLYLNLEKDYSNATEKRIRLAMNYIKENHTYINRVKSLFIVLGENNEN